MAIWQKLRVAILLPLALLQAAPTPPKVYACSTYLNELGINVWETAGTDGGVRSTAFAWYGDGLMTRVGGQGETPGTVLKWPGGHLFTEEPLDWAHGSLGFSPSDPMEKRERWTQLFIDRAASIRTLESRGKTYLTLIAGAWFASVTNQYLSPFELPLDNLLAWGTGVPTLTLYHVAWRKPGEGSPRVIGTYRLNVAALRAKLATIQVRVDAWRASLGDRRGCPLQDDVSGDVVVTDARR